MVHERSIRHAFMVVPMQEIVGQFMATSLIGFIALAGIIVRNSILLDGIAGGRRSAGMSLG